MATRSNLLTLQAPGGTLVSSRLRRITDPISSSPPASIRMRHFFDGVYDTSAESHLSRFCKVLLGDSGAGYLQRVYLYAKTQSVLATMRFGDLDAFYGDVLGLKRMSWERTDPARYLTANTPSEWDEIDARDASYRARIESFSRAIGLGGTPEGLIGVGSALIGSEIRLYESYLIIDQSGQEQPNNEPLQPRTYAQVESDLQRYVVLDGMTYGDIEGHYGTLGRADVNDRSHFTVRPMRVLSSEETYQLQRIIDRFKPVGTAFTIDPQGVKVTTPIKMRGVSADSTHWEIITIVQPTKERVRIYDPETPNVPLDGSARMEVVRPATHHRQGEVWSYNSDVVRSTAYRELPEAHWPDLPDPDDYDQRLTGVPEIWRSAHMTPPLRVNFDRVKYPTGTRNYTPDLALSPQRAILQGRAVSDSVSTASPVITSPDIVGLIRGPIESVIRNRVISDDRYYANV